LSQPASAYPRDTVMTPKRVGENARLEGWAINRSKARYIALSYRFCF
jgi:hypothetical protein